MFEKLIKTLGLVCAFGLALNGCADEDGCARLADFAQMCNPSISDDDVDTSEAFCDALVGDDAANDCVDCREDAADPCNSDAECEAICNVDG